MFCQNCGSKIPEDAKFCGKCGRQVLDMEPPTVTATEPLATDPISVSAAKPAAEPLPLRGAYVLWFFWGLFGAHQFYMGRKLQGVLRIVITIGIGIIVFLVQYEKKAPIENIVFYLMFIPWLFDAVTMKRQRDKSGAVGTLPLGGAYALWLSWGGLLGAHQFYMGRVLEGVLRIIITLFLAVISTYVIENVLENSDITLQWIVSVPMLIPWLFDAFTMKKQRDNPKAAGLLGLLSKK
jgi:TM2 domain-containing membrane protein YozV